MTGDQQGASADVRRMVVPGDLASFPAATRPFVSGIETAVLADDGMYEGDDKHYLACGASALNAIMAAQLLAERPVPDAVLDFGSGAGRVTRWLRACYPSARVDCCDLRPADLDFCRSRFGAETWVSGIDIAALAAPRRYDLIWVGSVLTHLPERNCRALLEKLLGWTRPGGLVVLSLLGRAAKETQERTSPYIHAEGWQAMKTEFAAGDFAYADYAGETGYGLSLAKPSWSARLLEGMQGVRLVLFAERAWDHSHDLVAVQNDGWFSALPPARDPRKLEIDALKARVAALEGSTSWRLTAPLRSAVKLLKRA